MGAGSGRLGMAWLLLNIRVYRMHQNSAAGIRGNASLQSAKGVAMLHYAAVFFVIALIAALFGFGGIAAGAVEIAKVLFFIFLILALVSAVTGLVNRGR